MARRPPPAPPPRRRGGGLVRGVLTFSLGVIVGIFVLIALVVIAIVALLF